MTPLKAARKIFFGTRLTLYFVCELTGEVPSGAEGIEIRLPDKSMQTFLRKCGPILKVGFQSLKYGSKVGKACGVPLDLGPLADAFDDTLNAVQQVASALDALMGDMKIEDSAVMYTSWLNSNGNGQHNAQDQPEAGNVVKRSYRELRDFIAAARSKTDLSESDLRDIRDKSKLKRAFDDSGKVGYVAERYEDLWARHGPNALRVAPWPQRLTAEDLSAK